MENNGTKIKSLEEKYLRMAKLIEYFRGSGLTPEDFERALEDIKKVYQEDKEN